MKWSSNTNPCKKTYKPMNIVFSPNINYMFRVFAFSIVLESPLSIYLVEPSVDIEGLQLYQNLSKKPIIRV